MSQDNGGKWQLAFWIVTIGTLTLVGYVVANDKERQKNDVEIREEYKKNDTIILEKTENKIELEVGKLEERIEKLQIEQTSMKIISAEILATLKQVYKEVKQ